MKNNFLALTHIIKEKKKHFFKQTNKIHFSKRSPKNDRKVKQQRSFLNVLILKAPNSDVQ